jgi:hypothetical protein
VCGGAHQLAQARQRVAAIGLLAAESLRIDDQYVLIADPPSGQFAQPVLNIFGQ